MESLHSNNCSLALRACCLAGQQGWYQPTFWSPHSMDRGTTCHGQGQLGQGWEEAPASPHAHGSATITTHGCVPISTAQFTAGHWTRDPPSSWLSLFSPPGNGPVPSIPHTSVRTPEVFYGKVKRGSRRERESLFMTGPTRRLCVRSQQATRDSRDPGLVAELSLTSSCSDSSLSYEPERRLSAGTGTDISV